MKCDEFDQESTKLDGFHVECYGKKEKEKKMELLLADRERQHKSNSVAIFCLRCGTISSRKPWSPMWSTLAWSNLVARFTHIMRGEMKNLGFKPKPLHIMSLIAIN